jgi:hypothetical protein
MPLAGSRADPAEDVEQNQKIVTNKKRDVQEEENRNTPDYSAKMTRQRSTPNSTTPCQQSRFFALQRGASTSRIRSRVFVCFYSP